jgi:hypothetical protein
MPMPNAFTHVPQASTPSTMISTVALLVLLALAATATIPHAKAQSTVPPLTSPNAPLPSLALPPASLGVPPPPVTGTPAKPSPPALGSEIKQAPFITSSHDASILRHRDYAGKPCLTVEGMARPHIANPNLYDHIISTSNTCPQRLKMRVCYSNSPECISVEVPGRDRKEVLLGTLPSIKDFSFEFHEQF